MAASKQLLINFTNNDVQLSRINRARCVTAKLVKCEHDANVTPSEKEPLCITFWLSHCCLPFLGYSAMEFVILSLMSTAGPLQFAFAGMQVYSGCGTRNPSITHTKSTTTTTAREHHQRLAVSGSRRVPRETRRQSTTSRLFVARRIVSRRCG